VDRSFLGRRAVLRLTAGAAAAVATGRSAGIAAPPAVSSREPALTAYDQTIVIDGLSYLQFDPLRDQPIAEDLFREVTESGVTAINYTLGTATFEDTVRAIAKWGAVIEDHPDHLIKARRCGDIERAKVEGKLAVLIGFQDPTPIGRDLPRLKVFHQLGLRILQLTENTQNLIGSGCNEARDGGLSRFGLEVVGRMNELGILIDVSHCGPRTTLDAIEASRKPVAITHSNCAALYQTPRAKTDEAIRAIGRTGGVMGITMLNFFVGAKPFNTIEDMAAHIDHVRAVAGIDHVGIGSDLPIGSLLQVFPNEATFMEALEPYIAASGSNYIHWPATIEGLDGPGKLRTLAQTLAARGYSSVDLAKVLGQNFLRVLRDSIG
jgi:membrane dipeptidase